MTESAQAHRALTRDERVDYIRKFGSHSLAFSSLQEGMEYFDVPGVGFVAYTKKWFRVIVFSDPICDESDLKRVIDLFLMRFPHSSWIQVSQRVIDILCGDFRYYGTQIGYESLVALPTWDTRGASKTCIRQALSHAARRHLQIQEGSTDMPTDEVSNNWLTTRKCKREIRFLIRPRDMGHHDHVRCFYAMLDGKIVGFIWFDPIFDRGQVIAYVPNISRSWSEFRHGLWYVIMAHAMEIFKSEGKSFVNLGMIPLSLSPEPEAHESLPLRFVLRLLHKNSGFYNFKGIEFAKDRFKGARQKCYAAHRHPFPVISFLALLRLCNVI